MVDTARYYHAYVHGEEEPGMGVALGGGIMVPAAAKPVIVAGPLVPLTDEDLWLHEVNEDPLLYVLEFRRRGLIGPPQYAPIEILRLQPPVNQVTVVHP